MTETRQYLQFTGDEIVADILLTMPEAKEILESYSLSCASCTLNAYETLRDGVLSHGTTQQQFALILSDLNACAAELQIPVGGKRSPVELTAIAAEKVRELQAQQNMPHSGFKIEVVPTEDGEPSYFLDFLDTPEHGDRVLTSQDIQLFLDPESATKLRNHTIDYIITPQGEGFKITAN